MPIPVTCSECNARLNAPDTAAGKALKCPKCGAKIVVPSSNDAQQIAPPPPKPKSPPVPPPAPPKVAEPIEEDFGGDDFDDEPKPKSKQRPREEDEDNFDDDQPPKKKGDSKTPPKKKKNPLLLIGVIGLVLFLLCGGAVVGVYYLVFNTAKNVVNNINDALKKGGDFTPQATKLPVDPNPQILNPTASFKFEPADGVRKIERLILSENGKTLVVVYLNTAYQTDTEVWDVSGTPKRLFGLKGGAHGISNGLLGHSDRKTYQLSDGKEIDKTFIGIREGSDNVSDEGAIFTESSVLRWKKPYAELKGRKPFNVYEDTKDKKILTHKVTDDERVAIGGVDSTRSLLAVGLRPENKILLYEFETKKIKREIVLAEPRPADPRTTSQGPSWNGFEIDPSLKWYGVNRVFLGKEPDPYEIFDGDGNVVVKLDKLELTDNHNTFLPNRDRFVTAITGLKKPFELYDLGVLNLKTKQFDTILRGQKQFTEKLVRSPDGSTVATTTKDSTIYIWDVSKLK